jgi:hypothetical protein
LLPQSDEWVLQCTSFVLEYGELDVAYAAQVSGAQGWSKKNSLNSQE